MIAYAESIPEWMEDVVTYEVSREANKFDLLSGGRQCDNKRKPLIEAATANDNLRALNDVW